MDGSKTDAETFLTSLLNKTLRITTTDTRLFVGEFKCTDSDRNIILSRTHEYRIPPPPSSTLGVPAPVPAQAEAEAEIRADKWNTIERRNGKVILDMTSRYLGLVVVPGGVITKIEVEEFASQVKVEGSKYARNCLAVALIRYPPDQALRLERELEKGKKDKYAASWPQHH